MLASGVNNLLFEFRLPNTELEQAQQLTTPSGCSIANEFADALQDPQNLIQVVVASLEGE